MTTPMRDAVTRPVRGIQQGGVAWAVLEVIEAFDIYDFTERQWGISIIVLGGVVSFVQNVIENRVGWGFLKKVPQEPNAAE